MERLLEQVTLRFSRLPMFPFFDLAHYTASVMSLKEQRDIPIAEEQEQEMVFVLLVSSRRHLVGPCEKQKAGLDGLTSMLGVLLCKSPAVADERSLYSIIQSLIGQPDLFWKARNQGAVEVSYSSPIACWFSAMLYCFGGSILSSLMLAEPPVAFLANTTSVLLASSVWYLVFYCPHDLAYRCISFLPIRLLVAGMKEVTRTWKITGGVTHAHSLYKNAWIIMIAIGWARGAGGGLISNFEQLVRGEWKPETNELLKMSCPTLVILNKQYLCEVYLPFLIFFLRNGFFIKPEELSGRNLKTTAIKIPVKISLVGAVLFTMQQTLYLPIAKHNLMLLYTIFLVATKVTMMMTTGYTASPFAPLEKALGSLLFGWQPSCSKVKGEAKVPHNGTSSSCDHTAGGEVEETVRKRHSKKME